MQTVVLRPLQHRGVVCIGLYFPISEKINSALRKTGIAKYSQSNKCWYAPLSKENYNTLFFALQEKAEIEQSVLHDYLAERKKAEASADGAKPADAKKQPVKLFQAEKQATANKTVAFETGRIQPVNAHILEAMEQQLKLKAYSRSTIKTYKGEMSQLLQLLGGKAADQLTPDDLRRYFVHCYDKLKLTENTLHSRINALKFYFEQVLGREKFFWEIPRPKKQLQLPKVLGEGEISNLFKALANKKHKAILFTAYSAGLRVSEVVNLRLKDIDSDRMQIFVKNAKGKKDRYVMLSPVLLDILRSYIRQMASRPSVYLFENPATTGQAYNVRSAQKVFQLAKEKAGIKKEVGFHSLRHSFATHLLEKGIDIRYIKDLLGHFDIRTTERYLHVKKEQLVNIISPIDDLWEKGKIEI